MNDEFRSTIESVAPSPESHHYPQQSLPGGRIQVADTGAGPKRSVHKYRHYKLQKSQPKTLRNAFPPLVTYESIYRGFGEAAPDSTPPLILDPPARICLPRILPHALSFVPCKQTLSHPLLELILRSSMSTPLQTRLTPPSGQPSSSTASWLQPSTYWTDLAAATPVPIDQSGSAESLGKLRRRGKPVPSPPFQTPDPPPDVPSQPDPYDPLFIPESILNAPIASQDHSKILQLPPEILALIFQKVKVPYFQVSLALTCKTLARVASQKNAMAPWRGYRDKDGLFRLLERKNKWMPDTLRLCRACFRFRPTDVTYWESHLRNPEFDNMKVNWYDIFSWFEPAYQQHRCPWCTISGYISYFREEQYLVDRDLNPGARRHPMCPDVTRRIAKP